MNSVHNLLNEVNLKTKPIESSGSKYTIPNEVFERLKLNTQFKLYHLEDNFNAPCCCAFFLVDNEWEKDNLRALKEQTGADLLIGIQTSDKFMATNNVIDGIVCCEIEQAHRIVHQLQAMLSVHGSYIAMDLNDVISLFDQCPYTQYAESKLYLSDDLTKQNKQEVDEFIDKLPIRNVKNLLLYTHSIESTSLEQFSEIVEMIDRRNDDSDMFLHGMALTNTLNYAYISVMYPIEPQQS
ncbi:hypothetical protein [Psychrobacter sp. ASPA161_6]|uniref:hypothetical protein n=1 Tax=Psychrobacter sp. ASPA161_6 TaxID=3160962 RepID=UPI003F7FE1AA